MVHQTTEKLTTFAHIVWASYAEFIEVGNQSSELSESGFELGLAYEVIPRLSILSLYTSPTKSLRFGIAFKN